jgi:hypothetical protein
MQKKVACISVEELKSIRFDVLRIAVRFLYIRRYPSSHPRVGSKLFTSVAPRPLSNQRLL